MYCLVHALHGVSAILKGKIYTSKALRASVDNSCIAHRVEAVSGSATWPDGINRREIK